jgi:6-phosphogluconolactonase
MTRAVVVHADATTLARATAARLLLRLLDAQSLHSPVHAVLTGGGLGTQVLAEVAGSTLRDAVDWTGVHIWWGDERFLPAGHPERNETQARDALLDALPLPAANVHPIPAADSPGIGSPEDAAAAYSAELARHSRHGNGTSDDAGPAVPGFDVLLLGVGPDGHTASLFPGQDTVEVTDLTAVGVHGSPKPPPDRVSLTFPAIEAADEVWLVAAGADKAEAVARALAGAEVRDTPAAGARGRSRTLWLLDVAAAG